MMYVYKGLHPKAAQHGLRYHSFVDDICGKIKLYHKVVDICEVKIDLSVKEPSEALQIKVLLDFTKLAAATALTFLSHCRYLTAALPQANRL